MPSSFLWIWEGCLFFCRDRNHLATFVPTAIMHLLGLQEVRLWHPACFTNALWRQLIASGIFHRKEPEASLWSDSELQGLPDLPNLSPAWCLLWSANLVWSSRLRKRENQPNVTGKPLLDKTDLHGYICLTETDEHSRTLLHSCLIF